MKLVSDTDLAVRARSFDLLPHLDTERLARIVEIHQRLDSTNDRAAKLAREGAVHGITVLAFEQTAGRGQRGRTWHSPPGTGLYASFLIRPTLTPRLAPALTVLSGLAVRDAVQSLVRTKLEVKWPNDLLVGDGPHRGKKLAGILVEASTDSFKIDHAIIGVGVNLDTVDRPPELRSRAIALEDLGALERSPALVLGRIAGALERRLDQAAVDGLAPIARDFTRHTFRRGERVTISADGERIQGTLTGIAEDGALILETPDGARTLYRGSWWSMNHLRLDTGTSPALPVVARIGAIAQLGERLNGIQEVDGSIPFGSNLKENKDLRGTDEVPFLCLTATPDSYADRCPASNPRRTS